MEKNNFGLLVKKAAMMRRRYVNSLIKIRTVYRVCHFYGKTKRPVSAYVYKVWYVDYCKRMHEKSLHHIKYLKHYEQRTSYRRNKPRRNRKT